MDPADRSWRRSGNRCDAGGGAAGTGRGGWRDADGREWCDTDHASTMTDLRLAARRLLATPLFTVFAVLSLAIGVAVTTAVYRSLMQSS